MFIAYINITTSTSIITITIIMLFIIITVYFTVYYLNRVLQVRDGPNPQYIKVKESALLTKTHTKALKGSRMDDVR